MTACAGNRSTMRGPGASAVGSLFRQTGFEFLGGLEQFAQLARITRQTSGFQNDALSSANASTSASTSASASKLPRVPEIDCWHATLASSRRRSAAESEKPSQSHARAEDSISLQPMQTLSTRNCVVTIDKSCLFCQG